MHALFLARLGIFVNNVSENCIAGSLHQQPWPESQDDKLPQLLLWLQSGHRLALILSGLCC